MGNEWEFYFTIGWLALWFLFPFGIFLSVGRLDHNSDELDRIVDYREGPEVKGRKSQEGFHWPHWGLRH